MPVAEVDNPYTPPCVRSLHGQLIEPATTCGDGACAIHAVFGTYTVGEYRKRNPRAFLRGVFGATASAFYGNLADPELYRQLEDILWKDLIKPCAEHAGGVHGVDAHLRAEGTMIWRELISGTREVAQQCVEASQAERRQYDALLEKRHAAVLKFARLCVRPLEYPFIRPLLVHLNMLEDYENTYPQNDEDGAPMSKLDILFTSSPEATRLQRSVVESCGVSNFHVLEGRIQDVVSGLTDEVDREPIDAFSNAVAAARACHVERASLPFPDFFTRVYPAYLRAMTADHSQYFLSDIELIAACKCSHTNVAIFRHDVDDNTFKLLRFFIHDAGRPVVLTSIQIQQHAGEVRSHFERLSLAAHGNQDRIAMSANDISTGAHGSGEESVETRRCREAQFADCPGGAASSACPPPSSSHVRVRRGPCGSVGGSGRRPSREQKQIFAATFSHKECDHDNSAGCALGACNFSQTSEGSAHVGSSADAHRRVAESAHSAEGSEAELVHRHVERSEEKTAHRQVAESARRAEESEKKPDDMQTWFDQLLNQRMSSPKLMATSVQQEDTHEDERSNEAESEASEENSDDDDAFGVKSQAADELSSHYTGGFLYRWHRAIAEVVSHMRDDVLLPIVSHGNNEPTLFTNVGSGMRLPAWHCPFHVETSGVGKRPCTAHAAEASRAASLKASHEQDLWAHVCSAHGSLLRRISTQWKLYERTHATKDLPMNSFAEEVHLTLLNAGLAEKERRLVPMLGHSTDRRAIQHTREVYREDNIEALMRLQRSGAPGI